MNAKLVQTIADDSGPRAYVVRVATGSGAQYDVQVNARMPWCIGMRSLRSGKSGRERMSKTAAAAAVAFVKDMGDGQAERILAESTRGRSGPPRRFVILEDGGQHAVYSVAKLARVSPYRRSRARALEDWAACDSGLELTT